MILRFLIVLLLALHLNAFATTNSPPYSVIGDILDQAKTFAREGLDPDILNELQTIERKTVLDFFSYQDATTNEIADLRAKIKENEMRLKADEYASATANEIANLKAWKRYYEAQLAEKLKDFSDIQQKINFLKLTPSQLSVLEQYNQSLKHHIAFREWITENVTWFEIGKDIAILVFGMFLESAWSKFKKQSAGKKK
jgi:seryl-tRNA synthetase